MNSKLNLIQLISRPIQRNEIEKLFKKEDCMCLINYENIIETGFFCNFNNKYIPFQKALLTNNHILNKTSIDFGKKIKLIVKQQTILIEMTEKRNKFTNESLDYTCIEIFEEDGINNFFNIDETVINNKSSLTNEEIFLLQYIIDKAHYAFHVVNFMS